jgi:hypothetical protein
MYLGKPPYDVEEARRLIATGLLEQQTSAKYGIAPIELIREISKIVLTEPQRREALRELTEYLGKPPVSEEEVNQLFSSGMLERQILTRYLMPLKELMNEVGFRTVRHSRGRIATDIP